MTSNTSDLTIKSEGTRKPGLATRLTIAEALFALVALAAGVLRLANLGRIPLSPAEAEAALAVWRFWQPGQMILAPASPAYFTLTAVLTQILGFSDAVMRLVPALFGVALTLLPWLLRQRLGIVGALVTAVFFAISPMTVIVARTAGGEAIALFAIFLLLAAWVRRQDSGDGRWPVTMAIALGLGLASAPLFYSGLAALALAWFLQTTVGPRLQLQIDEGAEDTGNETAVWPRAALVGLLVLLSLSSTFLLNISGIGGAAALLADWLRQFGRSALAAGTTPLLAVGRYETALMIIGPAAVIWAGWRRPALGRLALYWLVGITAVLLLQLGVIVNAALVPLAGYLLLGSFTGSVVGSRIHPRGWALTGGLLLVWGLMFVNLSRFLRTSAFDATDLSHIWIAIFGLTLALTTIYFLVTWDHRSTYQGILFSVLAMLIFYNWGTAWWLGQEAANDPRETWVTTGAADEVRLLVDQIRDLSWQVAGSETDVDIFSAINSPVLGWYLRDFPNFQMADAVPPAATFSLILTPDLAEPAFGSDYMGADYGLLNVSPVSEGPNVSTVLDTLRWWVFQESTAVSPQQRVVLWLRADLAQ